MDSDQGGSAQSDHARPSARIWLRVLVIAVFLVLILLAGIGGYLLGQRGGAAMDSTDTSTATPQPSFDTATKVTVTTHPIPQGTYGGAYPDKRDYRFENGLYAVSFVMSTYTYLYDYYTDPGYDGTAALMAEFSTHENGAEKKLFTLDTFNTTDCFEDLCTMPVLSTEDLYGNTWEFLGAHEYCDIGPCSGSKYVYRKEFGNYVAYIRTDLPLHGSSMVKRDDIALILSSIKFTTL